MSQEEGITCARVHSQGIWHMVTGEPRLEEWQDGGQTPSLPSEFAL